MLARRLLFSLASSEAFERAVERVPGARERAWRSARRYVAGEAVGDALRIVAALGARGLASSVELLGERSVDAHIGLAAGLPEETWLSLDLGQVGHHVTAL